MLRAFLGPFAVTLPVALFILDMQFLWVYADDMIGKGLELWVVFKLMVFASARLVNLALPLAVLVASIMALGNLAERNELTAMKASGMSFLRILRPLVVCMVFLCGGALWFSNTGWPAANMKFRALLYSVTKQKPAFNLREGVFYNGIDGFSIRVGTKHADGRLEDLLVHDHRDTQGQRVLVVQAERGHMSESDGHLVIELEDGVSYEEHQETMSRSKERVYPHVRSSFQRQTLRIPLHSLDFSMANEDLFRRSYERMTLAELAQTGDSLRTEIQREGRELQNYGKRNVAWRNDTTGWYASRCWSTTDRPLPLGRQPRLQNQNPRLSFGEGTLAQPNPKHRQRRRKHGGQIASPASARHRMAPQVHLGLGVHGAVFGGQLVGGARRQRRIGPAHALGPVRVPVVLRGLHGRRATCEVWHPGALVRHVVEHAVADAVGRTFDVEHVERTALAAPCRRVIENYF